MGALVGASDDPASDRLGRAMAELPDELGVDLEVKLTGGLLRRRHRRRPRCVGSESGDRTGGGSRGRAAHGVRSPARRAVPSHGMTGGLLCPLEGKANPLLGDARARARCRGARRPTGGGDRAARDRAEAQRVPRGDSAGAIDRERIVDCAGTAAGEVSALVGVPLPVESWPLQAHVTEPVVPLLRHLVYFAGERLTLKRAAAGSILIGGGWPSEEDSAAGTPGISLESLHANLRVAQHVVPALAQVRLLRVWTGVCNGTPDHRPIPRRARRRSRLLRRRLSRISASPPRP
mgnify:CR=1 FL=1